MIISPRPPDTANVVSVHHPWTCISSLPEPDRYGRWKIFPQGKSMRRIDPPFPYSPPFAKRPFIVSTQYLPLCPLLLLPAYFITSASVRFPSCLSRNHHSLVDLISFFLDVHSFFLHSSSQGYLFLWRKWNSQASVSHSSGSESSSLVFPARANAY
jgi:hypothetical protein